MSIQTDGVMFFELVEQILHDVDETKVSMMGSVCEYKLLIGKYSSYLMSIIFPSNI